MLSIVLLLNAICKHIHYQVNKNQIIMCKVINQVYILYVKTVVSNRMNLCLFI